MIITNSIVIIKLSKYSNKNNKISRDIRNGKYFGIIKGLYESVSNIPGYLLAGAIYKSSYISFEYIMD